MDAQLETVKTLLPHMNIPEGAGSSSAGLEYGDGRKFNVQFNASLKVLRPPSPHTPQSYTHVSTLSLLRIEPCRRWL
jgi:hypothetical protein